MRLGVRIEADLFYNEKYRQLFEKLDPFVYLKNLGVEAIEISVGPNTSEKKITEFALLSKSHGLTLSLSIAMISKTDLITNLLFISRFPGSSTWNTFPLCASIKP